MIMILEDLFSIQENMEIVHLARDLVSIALEVYRFSQILVLILMLVLLHLTILVVSLQQVLYYQLQHIMNTTLHGVDNKVTRLILLAEVISIQSLSTFNIKPTVVIICTIM